MQGNGRNGGFRSAVVDPKATVGITLLSGLRCATQRSHSQNLPCERPDFTSSQAIVSPDASVPGFTEFLYLDVYTGRSLKTQAASHFQEEAVSRIFRIGQFVPQVLRSKLR